GDAAQERLLRAYDAFEALGTAIQPYDSLGAALLQARAVRCALDAGEPKRVLRALCSAAVTAATSGSASADREVDELLQRASALAKQHPSDHAFGSLATGQAVSAFMRSKVQAVVEPSLEADRLLQAVAAEAPEKTGVYDYSRRF